LHSKMWFWLTGNLPGTETPQFPLCKGPAAGRLGRHCMDFLHPEPCRSSVIMVFMFQPSTRGLP
jgi:hypothetical protein